MSKPHQFRILRLLNQSAAGAHETITEGTSLQLQPILAMNAKFYALFVVATAQMLAVLAIVLVLR